MNKKYQDRLVLQTPERHGDVRRVLSADQLDRLVHELSAGVQMLGEYAVAAACSSIRSRLLHTPSEIRRRQRVLEFVRNYVAGGYNDGDL